MGRKSREKQLRRKEREQLGAIRQGPRAIERFGFEIQTEAMEMLKGKYPPEVEECRKELYLTAKSDPRRAVPKLEALVERFPDIAELKNWLSVAYSHNSDQIRAVAMIKRTIREHPDYLFAKLNYAEICLHSGRFGEVPALFGGKTELHELYPERKRFHITEFSGFYYVMVQYALATGDLAGVRKHFQKLKVGAPNSEATQLLEAKLHSLAAEMAENIAGSISPLDRHGSKSSQRRLIDV